MAADPSYVVTRPGHGFAVGTLISEAETIAQYPQIRTFAVPVKGA